MSQTHVAVVAISEMLRRTEETYRNDSRERRSRRDFRNAEAAGGVTKWGIDQRVSQSSRFQKC